MPSPVALPMPKRRRKAGSSDAADVAAAPPAEMLDEIDRRTGG